jgi:hypothetical protein
MTGVGGEVEVLVHRASLALLVDLRETDRERTQRLRYHSALPSRSRTPCTIRRRRTSDNADRRGSAGSGRCAGSGRRLGRHLAGDRQVERGDLRGHRGDGPSGSGRPSAPEASSVSSSSVGRVSRMTGMRDRFSADSRILRLAFRDGLPPSRARPLRAAGGHLVLLPADLGLHLIR